MAQETPTQPALVETLHIQNFAGMSDVTLELSRMNVLIGPSASGKSVCAKLLYFFKESVWRMRSAVSREKSVKEALDEETQCFLRFFPPLHWGKGDFTITYTRGNFVATVTGRNTASPTAKIVYPESFFALRKQVETATRFAMEQPAGDTLDKWVKAENEFETLLAAAFASTIGTGMHAVNKFIPAGRQMSVLLDINPGEFREAGIALDPFVEEFAFPNALALSWVTRNAETIQQSQDERTKLSSRLAFQLLRGRLGNTPSEPCIVDDGNSIPIGTASSGQQAAVPLVAILQQALGTDTWLRHWTKNLFIEEPEAHLYPTAQRDVVHLMAAVTDLFGSAEGSQYVLTTHSPYILSALNNLMYGGKIVRNSPDKKDKVLAILPEQVLVDPAYVRAYMMEGGGAESIIGSESGLIVASEIDGVSNILGAEFNRLLDVEFDDEDETGEDAA